MSLFAGGRGIGGPFGVRLGIVRGLDLSVFSFTAAFVLPASFSPAGVSRSPALSPLLANTIVSFFGLDF